MYTIYNKTEEYEYIMVYETIGEAVQVIRDYEEEDRKNDKKVKNYIIIDEITEDIVYNNIKNIN